MGAYQVAERGWVARMRPGAAAGVVSRHTAAVVAAGAEAAGRRLAAGAGRIGRWGLGGTQAAEAVGQSHRVTWAPEGIVAWEHLAFPF